jgi:hypothetical protein
MPINPVVAAFTGAIAKGGKRARQIKNGWKPNTAGSPIYPHSKANGNDERIVVYTDIPRGADESPATTEEEWALVERLGPWTIDAALSCLVQMCERSSIDSSMYSAINPEPQPAVMTADTILRNKGFQRRGQERRAMYPRIDDEVRALQSMKYEASWSVKMLVNGKLKFGIRKWKNDQLFNIVATETWQSNLWSDVPDKCVSVKWSIACGQWAQFWFNADLKPWIANCASTLLTLDNRQNRGPELMAK